MWKILENADTRNTHQYVIAQCTLCDRIFTVRLSNIRAGRSSKCVQCAIKQRPKTGKGKPRDRTLKIIELLKQGQTAAEIAKSLNCSPNRAYEAYKRYIKG